MRNQSTGFRRDPPDLPAYLGSSSELCQVWADGEIFTIQEMRVQDQQRTNLRAGSFRIEGSLLERIQLAGGQFGSAVWKDVRFAGCDFANIAVKRMELVRAEFIDCRLTGLSATAFEWKDVLIRNCDVSYAQLPGGSFQNCESDGCNWHEADLQNADLSGSVFRSCNLERTDFHGAKLQNTDFRTSEVEEMRIGMNDLRGAIVDPAQAMVFARVLGLQIR
jgi:uncharacterized protein YjbI with pentapeptide repeats